MFFPFPHKIYKDVTSITPNVLKSLGVKGLLLDIDGTLARTREAEPKEDVARWLKMMKESGIALFVLSNNKSPVRTEGFAKSIGCGWMHRSRKPGRAGFMEASRILGIPPSELAIVGDQIYTDVLGGLRCGMKAIMVQSSDTYLWYFPFRRLIELPFRYERKK
ncbi:MAG: YqeG family HAD IIIA-type phosphatase [Clostridiaceae bacterium]|nr:YqeG family HAD IIIA-type phosphatase [Clostridiaceae bacterium]